MALFCSHSSPNPARSGADRCYRFRALLLHQSKVWRHKCLTTTTADRKPQERHSWAINTWKHVCRQRFLAALILNPRVRNRLAVPWAGACLAHRTQGSSTMHIVVAAFLQNQQKLWGQEVKIPLILLIIPPLSCWLSTLVISLAEELMENTSVNSSGDKKQKSAVIRKFWCCHKQLCIK